VAALPRLLRRFQRLLTPPGRPASALGVPASGESLEGELQPLLTTLDEIDGEARAIVARAEDEAARRREAAAREAAAIVERARGSAAAEYERAVAAARAQRADRAGAQAQADREVERIRSLSDERVGRLVSEVIECVRSHGR
jgi:hypothetical protein